MFFIVYEIAVTVKLLVKFIVGTLQLFIYVLTVADDKTIMKF